MGWFSSSTKPSPEEVVSTREDRKKCWEARDAYFACLDGAAVVKPGTEGGVCKREETAYEGECAKSWIEYFNQRRIIADVQKDRLAQANTQAQAAKR